MLHPNTRGMLAALANRVRRVPLAAPLAATISASLAVQTQGGGHQDASNMSNSTGAPARSLALNTPSKGQRTAKLAHTYEYDVLVLGGGSGGLACAREAAALQGKVALFDYVTPSARGTKWGLGGTCVNVGCIPKKLMHQAALHGQGLHDALEYGWKLPPLNSITHDWHSLTSNIHSYIKGTNWGYKNALRDERIEYNNALGKVVDAHTVEFTDVKTKETKRISAAHIVIAVGGRPRYPDDVEGAVEHGITSDDLFWLGDAPGKTLLIGAGYVALECAGFMTHIGLNATVMARGQVLRGFDQEMAEKIVTNMQSTGTRFLRGCQPIKIEKATIDGPSLKVTFKQVVADETGRATTLLNTEFFDTVVFATGRSPLTKGIGLDVVGVKTDGAGKIIGNRGNSASSASVGTTGSSLQHRDTTQSAWSETSSVESIHALGDVLAGTPELTPVAIRAGKLLAQRLMKGYIPTSSSDSPRHGLTMDYSLIPTTIFTPTEYGCVGMSEAEALQAYGSDGVDVYHLAYDTLELGVSHRSGIDGLPLPPQCYTKLVVQRGSEKVLGLHVLGPNAGDVIQGFAVAMRLGATKADLDSTVGIHPTHAEEVVMLDRTKRSGAAFVKTSC